MGSASTNNAGDFGVIASFQNVVYHSSSFAKFTYYNKINERPRAEMLIIDRNDAASIYVKSADYMRLTFLNTTDNTEDKFSSIVGIITDMGWENAAGQNSLLRIKWEAGTASQLKVGNFTHKGSSSSALDAFLASRESRVNNVLTGNYEPSDNMTWRVISGNMWHGLTDIVSNSYRSNDYIFWAWDDVNDSYKISSFQFEKSKKVTQGVIESGNAIASTQDAKLIYPNLDVMLWQYDKIRRESTFGKNLDKLYPNVVITNVNQNNIDSGNAKQQCFSDMLTDMGDTKQSQLAATTDMKDPNMVFSPVSIKRHYSNNTHSMYPVASTYRDYTYSMHGKVIYVVIYNNIGPAIGTYVQGIVTSSDSSVRALTIDEIYTDRYLVVEKSIEWSTADYTSLGKSASTSDNWKTTLTLICDNPMEGKPEELEEFYSYFDNRKKPK